MIVNLILAIFLLIVNSSVVLAEDPSPTPTPTDTPTPSPESNICTDPAPGSAPKLSSGVVSKNEVTLTWTKANDPVTYYLLAYGISSGKYIYGVPNIGGRDTTSFTVGGLTPGKKYYFVIRAGNGCTPGTFSNEIQLTTLGGVPVSTPISTPEENIIIESTQDPETPSPKPEISPSPDLSQNESSTISTDKIIGLMTLAGVVLGIVYIILSRKDKKKKAETPINDDFKNDPYKT